MVGWVGGWVGGWCIEIVGGWVGGWDYLPVSDAGVGDDDAVVLLEVVVACWEWVGGWMID